MVRRWINPESKFSEANVLIPDFANTWINVHTLNIHKLKNSNDRVAQMTWTLFIQITFINIVDENSISDSKEISSWQSLINDWCAVVLTWN